MLCYLGVPVHKSLVVLWDRNVMVSLLTCVCLVSGFSMYSQPVGIITNSGVSQINAMLFRGSCTQKSGSFVGS